MLGGFLVPLVGLCGMVVFSLSAFIGVSLVGIWLFLELAGLCLIPLFFVGPGWVTGLSGLFYYIVFSGVSSALLLFGVLLPSCSFFVVVGFLMKFGVFPLWGWVYWVFCFSSWLPIWGLSGVLKVFFLFLPFFLISSPLVLDGLLFLCGLSCFFLSVLFWVYTYDWKICWCHMMLSSSSVFFALGVGGSDFLVYLFLYIVYLFWCSLVLFYFYRVCGIGFELFSGHLCLFLFCFLLLVLPVSLSVFYKFLVCSCVFSCGLFLLCCWVVYSISEQVYLFLILTGLSSSKSDFSFLFSV